VVRNGYSTATYDNAGEVQEVKAYNASGVSVPAENFFYGYDVGWNLLKRTNNAERAESGGGSWLLKAETRLIVAESWCCRGGAVPDTLTPTGDS
jgi:hypothetical protein